MEPGDRSSLINSDYKILTFKLKRAISNVLNHDQIGFIPGRKISEMIRHVDNIIKYGKSENTIM